MAFMSDFQDGGLHLLSVSDGLGSSETLLLEFNILGMLTS